MPVLVVVVVIRYAPPTGSQSLLDVRSARRNVTNEVRMASMCRRRCAVSSSRGCCARWLIREMMMMMMRCRRSVRRVVVVLCRCARSSPLCDPRYAAHVLDDALACAPPLRLVLFGER